MLNFVFIFLEESYCIIKLINIVYWGAFFVNFDGFCRVWCNKIVNVSIFKFVCIFDKSF